MDNERQRQHPFSAVSGVDEIQYDSVNIPGTPPEAGCSGCEVREKVGRVVSSENGVFSGEKDGLVEGRGDRRKDQSGCQKVYYLSRRYVSSNSELELEDCHEPFLSSEQVVVPLLGSSSESVLPTSRRAEGLFFSLKYFRTFFAFMGPGFLVAMAYLDPGNLTGDLAVGSIRLKDDPSSGYRLLWLLLWGHVIGYVFQTFAIRVGNVTGTDLATLCRLEYRQHISTALWFITELAIIAADVQAVIGSAVALNLLFEIPIALGIIITLVDTFTFLTIQVVGVRKLEALFALLITILAACFWLNCYISKPNLWYVFKGLTVPSIPQGHGIAAIGLLGCIIMPHNIFLHSALVQSRKVNRNSTQKLEVANLFFAIETAFALLVSFAVNAAVVVSFANPLISTESISLYTAHEALGLAFGQRSVYIWGIGLLAAGQNATMAGTYAGQFVMQGFLNLDINPWVRLLATRLVAILPLGILAFLDRNSIDLISDGINLFQAAVLPFAILPLLKFNCSKTTMGCFALTGLKSSLLWTLATILILINIVGGFLVAQTGLNYLFFGLGLTIYLYLIFQLLSNPIKGSYCLYNQVTL